MSQIPRKPRFRRREIPDVAVLTEAMGRLDATMTEARRNRQTQLAELVTLDQVLNQNLRGIERLRQLLVLAAQQIDRLRKSRLDMVNEAQQIYDEDIRNISEQVNTAIEFIRNVDLESAAASQHAETILQALRTTLAATMVAPSQELINQIQAISPDNTPRNSAPPSRAGSIGNLSTNDVTIESLEGSDDEDDEDDNNGGALAVNTTPNRLIEGMQVSPGLPEDTLGRQWSNIITQIAQTRRWSDLAPETQNVLQAAYELRDADVRRLLASAELLVNERIFTRKLHKGACRNDRDAITLTYFSQIPYPFTIKVDRICYNVESVYNFHNNGDVGLVNYLTRQPITADFRQDINARYEALRTSYTILQNEMNR